MSTIVETRTVVSAPAEHRTHDLRPVKTHQAIAVACALVCFAPLGVAAVVHAGKVRTQLALGDLDGARRASRVTAALCWASAAATMVCLLVVVIGAGTYSDFH